MTTYIIIIFIILFLFVLTKNENFNQDDFIKKTVNYYYDEYNNKLTSNYKNNQKSVNNLANLYDSDNFFNVKYNSLYYPAYSTKYIPIKITSPDWYHNKN